MRFLVLDGQSNFDADDSFVVGEFWKTKSAFVFI